MPHFLRRFLHLTTTLAAALLVACAPVGIAHAQPAQDADDDEDDAPQANATPAKPPANLPLQDLNSSLLYDFLRGEIAAQRGSPGFAAQTYLALAKRTRDPRVAKRAVELATSARAPQMALEAARVWQDVDPAWTNWFVVGTFASNNELAMIIQ